MSDPHNPTEVGSVRLGGIVHGTPHPAAPDLRLRGAPDDPDHPDGRLLRGPHSLYPSWDGSFYPTRGPWMAPSPPPPHPGAPPPAPGSFPPPPPPAGWGAWTRLPAGDASGDSFCFVDLL